VTVHYNKLLPIYIMSMLWVYVLMFKAASQ